MRNKILIYPFAIMGILLVLTISCKKVGNNTDIIDGTTMKDSDGNVYKTVKIGTQIWMAENLKTTKYRNGDTIANPQTYLQWGKFSVLKTGSYCWYNNEETTYKKAYGALYNWFAVNDKRNIAPIGWHVPTKDEWVILIDFLGGGPVAGPKMKSTSGWIDNGNGTNESGFTGLPAGMRSAGGNATFWVAEKEAAWWSSTEGESDKAWAVGMTAYSSTIDVSYSGSESHGISVRCVKD